MKKEVFIQKVEEELDYKPTEEQQEAIVQFVNFYFCSNTRSIFLLRGCAGTGKTTITSAIVRALQHTKQKIVLLAPTGRAANVLSVNSGFHANTIHSLVYHKKSYLGSATMFNIALNMHKKVLFIVDEASMISNTVKDTNFGSGRVLDDLIEYVYNGYDCRLMFIGDKAQLPPVGENESQGLTINKLHGYGLQVFHADLKNVMRQKINSGILTNATVIRQFGESLLSGENVNNLPEIIYDGYQDIICLGKDKFMDTLADSYERVGYGETIVVTRTNNAASKYNQQIRKEIFHRDQLLASGDILMSVKNNFRCVDKKKSPMNFIANGDRAVVEAVGNFREQYGFHFADAILRFPDYDNFLISTIVLLDTLISDYPSLSPEENEKLFQGVLKKYSYITNPDERIKKVQFDEYFNALQIKYAYAVTCHKAQGGQWSNVFLDQGRITRNSLTTDYIHWLYTAITRAKERLWIIN